MPTKRRRKATSDISNIKNCNFTAESAKIAEKFSPHILKNLGVLDALGGEVFE